MVLDNRIWFGQKGDAIPSIKRFLSEVQQGIVPSTIWFRDEVGDNQEASEEIKNILGFIALDNPKPTRLIQRMLQLGTDKNATVLDFFAGSGTTGQAVLEQNKLDGGARKFILCTNNGDEKSEHKIATDICYPRIKKVIGGYKNLKGLSIEGIGGNLRYFTAYDFVESEPTDKNKRKLVKKSSEMLCIKEGVYDLVKETEEYKIFKNSQDKYLGVIFYEDAISEYKKELKKINHQVHTYVFSLGDDPYRAEFEDVKGKVILHPIPEVILRVYKEIFK
jgi:adenine-specific DNA-methyltransferase